jgi:CTD nuclear envelope phosphatase 1
MNSLNILSSRVIGQTTSSNPSRTRSHSLGEASPGSPRGDLAKSRSYSEQQFHFSDGSNEDEKERGRDHELPPSEHFHDDTAEIDEKTPLLRGLQKDATVPAPSKLFLIAQRLFDAIAETIKVILSTLAAPGVYASRFFRDDDGYYSPVVPVRKIRRSMASVNGDAESSRAKPAMTMRGKQLKGDSEKSGARRGSSSRKLRNSSSRESIASSTSESEVDRRSLKASSAGGTRHTRSKSQNLDPATDDATPRRSIRIKLHNEEALKRHKKRSQSADVRQSLDDNSSGIASTLAADSLKSPTSPPSHRITKYPHAPAPPRPLVPARQPSYTLWTSGRDSHKVPQKTLVLDLDETLIHSLAKGGRMSSGHMVEVKLTTPMTASAAPGEPPTTVGPQHPILYYVHKRPHCDEFLRKVCKWYKLVIFTASVQEYADPVIDWLEQERKFFQARYYRQHCTLRNGAFIKDLSSVEPDLSKVMILDNSPISYIFHEGVYTPHGGSFFFF